MIALVLLALAPPLAWLFAAYEGPARPAHQLIVAEGAAVLTLAPIIALAAHALERLA